MKDNQAICRHRAAVLAPFNDSLTPQERTEKAIELSQLVTKIATYIICHTIVDYQEQLKQDERLSIAHAILQRVTTTHMCNHKLTVEGLAYEYRGQQFQLHEAYKTMGLTRSVYEHLAMFYFLYEHPKTNQERDAAWEAWQKDERSIPYSQAWRFLFRNREMAQLYHHLSIHCHPAYAGLQQFQSQDSSDNGADGIPLHLSSCFLAYLCRLFLKQISHGDDIVRREFSAQELSLFRTLSQLPNVEK